MNSHNQSDGLKFSAGYFGKLPNFPDFIKYNAAGPEILILDRWIQEGILWSKKTGKNISNSGLPDRGSFNPNPLSFSFLFPFTGTENILIGMIYPSRDKTGREFPFIIFMILNRNKLINLPSYLIPLSFCGWFDYCRNLFIEIKSNTSPVKESLFPVNKSINSIRELTLDLEKNISAASKISYNKFITETSQKEFRERTLDDADGARFPALLSSLEKGLSFLILKQNADVSFGMQVSFNYSEEYNFHNAAFFMNLVMLISGRESILPAFFIKNDNRLSELFIFFSSPAPRHYSDLFRSSGNNEGIFYANSGINSAETMDKKFFSENDELKLKDLLNRFDLKIKALE